MGFAGLSGLNRLFSTVTLIISGMGLGNILFHVVRAYDKTRCVFSVGTGNGDGFGFAAGIAKNFYMLAVMQPGVRIDSRRRAGILRLIPSGLRRVFNSDRIPYGLTRSSINELNLIIIDPLPVQVRVGQFV